MLAYDTRDVWTQFLDFVKSRCSATAYGNWLAPIQVIESSSVEITLEVPNIFVKEYLLSNYKRDLAAFVPVDDTGEPSIKFVISPPNREKAAASPSVPSVIQNLPVAPAAQPQVGVKLNSNYRFDSFIEGPANQFVKSAAMGIATRPGQSYNPLFVHGGVGLGKTHILHSIGHHVKDHLPKLKVQCISTEGFINELVDNLRNKSVDRMKRFYRSDIDVLLVDDIQFLQDRLNFEEEFCNTFETLINQNKQIVITSDKPPAQLKLSERMIARMEWGLVAHMGMPEVETRVAILQHKADLKGIHLPDKVAFYIAEHIVNNVRQLEGAINKLTAHSRLLNQPITEELVEKTLRETLQQAPRKKISVEEILKSVAAVFQVRVSDLKGATRTKDLALARQVAMFLCREMISESLMMLSAFFGKTHSTILHGCKTIDKKMGEDETLKRQIDMVRRNIGT